MNAAARMLVIALGSAGCAIAADSAPAPTWPPSPEVRSRMTELQLVISDPKATLATRDSARAELKRLLGSPAAAKPAAEAEEAPRRARTPLAVAPPMPSPAPPSTGASVTGAPRESDPPVAHVVPAPRAIPPFIDPQTGRTLVPSGQVAIDPATGRALPQVPGGYVDPATGRAIRPR